MARVHAVTALSSTAVGSSTIDRGTGTAMNAASATDPWDRHWAYGNLHSFSQVTHGNYGGHIAALRGERFAALPEGACIVDVATGNDAVALC